MLMLIDQYLAKEWQEVRGRFSIWNVCLVAGGGAFYE